MDATLQTVINGALLAFFTLTLAILGKHRIDALQADLNSFKAEVRAEFTLLRSEMTAEFASIRAEMAIMRSDLTHVALAVGARQRPQTG